LQTYEVDVAIQSLLQKRSWSSQGRVLVELASTTSVCVILHEVHLTLPTTFDVGGGGGLEKVEPPCRSPNKVLGTRFLAVASPPTILAGESVRLST
jgi:hypothetical protein